MTRPGLILATLILATLPAGPALAKWKLASSGEAVAVAKSTLKVTPGEDWNKSTYRPIKKGEIWTLDGVALNELYFVSGLVAGETLYRDTAKKDRPLPVMGQSMQLTDIPDFFESSQRVAMTTSLFEVTGSEPTTVAGRLGIRFTFQYALQGSPLVRKGIAFGAIIDNGLYLMSFTAPAIHYFDRDAAKAEAIMASAQM